jgi:FkbH-like protein
MAANTESFDRTRPAARPEASGAHHRTGGGDGVIGLIIETAPDLLRQRALLQAVDWRAASAAEVGRLRDRLAEAGREMPVWLARPLLVAGHAVPVELAQRLDPALGVLAALVDSATAMADATRREIEALTAAEGVDAAVATQIVRRLIDRGEARLACSVALGQWRHAPGIVSGVRKLLAAETASMPTVRVRLAALSTSEVLADALTLAFAAEGRRLEITSAEYGAVLPELLRPAGEADARIVQLDQSSVVAPDWRQGAAAVAAATERRIDDLASALARYASREKVPLLINTLPVTSPPVLGHVDAVERAGAAATVRRLNERLAEVAATSAVVQLVDAEAALHALAPSERTDPKLWYYGRVAYSQAATDALARAFAGLWQARHRGPAKVIALVFDNTLWGGVFGDDGIGRLACGDDFPGNAFKALQQECLRLKAQGMLLVALSKNNADAISVFAEHPGMALKADDFAAIAIDWEPKPANIRRLAEELNLGLDSFVFLDDSPHEREAMRRLCPEVVVPEMPADPAERPLWLRSLACTWPLRLTAEDGRRTEMYVAERKSRHLRDQAASYDDYLRELGQVLLVERLSETTLARVSQLHERTNQFNLTTRRLGEAELAAAMRDPAGAVALLGTVEDRFGSHGIVIAAVATVAGRTARIETFLMSCRVMSRQVETAFLGALIDRLVALGASEVEGLYLPTRKNGMVRDFYPSHGFSPRPAAGEGQHWVWEQAVAPPPATPFVSLKWRPS